MSARCVAARGRRQIISVAHERASDIKAVFEPIHQDAAALLEQFDGGQLTAIADFLDQMTDCVYRHVSLLRAFRGAYASESDPRNSTRPTGQDQREENAGRASTPNSQEFNPPT